MSEVVTLLDYLGVDPNDFSWQDLGLCRGNADSNKVDQKMRGDLFYDTYETDPTTAANVDRMCAVCPVRDECATQGQETRQWGVWGGVYWDGTGKPDLDRNSHKTWEEWLEIERYVYISDKTMAQLRERYGIQQ